MPNDNSAHHQGLSAYRQAATLELCDVSKRYPGQPRDALKDLSLSVGAGEVCVLVGPSGSGKTTAMRLINRMIPLTSGEILLGGRSVLERGPNELRREIGYVIQQIGLFPHLTVEENIATVRMDEPVGAIDPINRTRLQDEFLRLQKQVRKTVVFCHPRHRRGDQDGRQDRDPARGGNSCPVRHARPDPRQPDGRVRRQVRRS